MNCFFFFKCIWPFYCHHKFWYIYIVRMYVILCDLVQMSRFNFIFKSFSFFAYIFPLFVIIYFALFLFCHIEQPQWQCFLTIPLYRHHRKLTLWSFRLLLTILVASISKTIEFACYYGIGKMFPLLADFSFLISQS